MLKRWIPAIVAAWCAATSAATPPPPTRPATTAGSAPEFRVFEWTPYHEKLLAPGTGIRPIWLIQDGFWAKAPDGSWDRTKPDEKATRATAWFLARKGIPVVIDIEHWPVDVRRASEAKVRESLTKLAQVADWLHAEKPGLRIGFYSLLPIQDFWTPVKYEQARRSGKIDPATRAEYDRWVNATALAAEYLGRRVDYVFPSLYTFYDDPAGWATYAAANLDEARKIGKPVYPFLWMNYHDSNAKLRGQKLPGAAWRRELDFCRAHADGLVIWGSGETQPDGRYGVPPWNETAPWWVETAKFMRGLRDGG